MDVIEAKKTHESEKVEIFLNAAYKADYEAVNNHLADGLSADVADDDNTTALQIASAQGNLPVMQILLNRGASVDKCNHCGFTPLLHAARNGKTQAVELLIRYGADPFRTTFFGTTALSLASAGGHLNVIVMLREYKSQTRRRAPTPLIAAIATKQYQIVIYLKFAGITQYPCRDTFYELDAFHVAEQLMDLKMKALLCDLGLQLLRLPSIYSPSGTSINQKSQVEIPKKTADIRCLIRDHQIGLVNWIMDLNDYSGLPIGTTPLMYAAIVGNVSMVQILLQRKCDINASCYGFTPIMIAIACGNDALTRYLIKKGANQSTNGHQFSLFELASNSDGISSATIQLLLTEPMYKMRLTERISAILRKILRRRKLICHQPIKLEVGVRQLSFLQKVVQNMGSKSNWVPEKLFDALAWPDCQCMCFEDSNIVHASEAVPAQLLEEKIMVSSDDQEQSGCLLNDYLSRRIKKDSYPIRSSNFEATLSLVDNDYLHMRQQQCSSISKLRSTLYYFDSRLPKNCSITSSNSINLSKTLNSIGWKDNEIPIIESINELCSAYKYEKKYRDIMNKRCSPDVCQKLAEQEIDYETFLILTKAEFISFGINRSDAGILIYIQKMLKEELNKI
ncbi:Ankyrin repeat and SAM domain-containing protein [Dirofilaria immitis]